MLWTYQTSHWHLQNVNKCGTFCGIEPKPIKMLNSIVGNKPWRRPVSGRTVAPAPWPHGSAYRRSRRRKCSNKVCESSSPSSGSSTWRLWPSCQDELLEWMSTVIRMWRGKIPCRINQDEKRAISGFYQGLKPIWKVIMFENLVINYMEL